MKRTIWITTSFALLALASTAWAEHDIGAGKAKAKTCAPCHGANGEGKGSFPTLAGMDEKKFTQALKDFKSGKRSNGMMKSVASKLSDKDMDNLADYYASLKPK